MGVINLLRDSLAFQMLLKLLKLINIFSGDLISPLNLCPKKLINGRLHLISYFLLRC